MNFEDNESVQDVIGYIDIENYEEHVLDVDSRLSKASARLKSYVDYFEENIFAHSDREMTLLSGDVELFESDMGYYRSLFTRKIVRAVQQSMEQYDDDDMSHFLYYLIDTFLVYEETIKYCGLGVLFFIICILKKKAYLLALIIDRLREHHLSQYV